MKKNQVKETPRKCKCGKDVNIRCVVGEGDEAEVLFLCWDCYSEL